MRRGRRLPILLVFFIVLAAFTVSFRLSVLRAAGRLLTIDEVTSRADIIVVPEWAGTAGALEAADLVRSGVSVRVAIIGEPARVPERELARRGVPVESAVDKLIQVIHRLGVRDVVQLTDAADGTEAEGRILPSFCKENHLRSIVVVSTPDHSRRIRRVMRRDMRAAGATTEITVKSATYSPFDPDRWWQTRDGTRTEIVEFEKLALDVVRHPFS